MKLIYKIALPAFLALILVIVWAALSAKRSLTEALSQEEFLRVSEAVRRKVPQYLKDDDFIRPFEAPSQKQLGDFADDLKGPSVARLTIWNRNHVIVFSDLKSLIGIHAPNHQDLKRLFSEERPFFIARHEDVNEPAQSGIGEFVDLYIPVRISGKIVGAVEVHSVIAALLAPVEKHVSDLVYILIPASVLILAIVLLVVYRDIAEQKRAQAQITRHLQQVTAMREIDQAITSTLDLRAVLGLLMERIDVFLPDYSATTVRLLNKETGLLEPVACHNLNEAEWKAARWRRGRGIPNIAFQAKAPTMIGNVQTDPQVRDPEFFRKHGLVSYLGVPLMIQEEILGVLSFYTKEKHDFSREEVELLFTLAGQAAIAIHNSQLYEEMTKLAGDLARSNRVKDEFLSVMSHELRTPLNVVLGYAGMIKEGLLGEINPGQQKALEKVLSRARDQLSLISGILAATQMEVEGIKVKNQDVSLGDFLDDLKAACGNPLEKAITLNWDCSVSHLVMKTDSEKLRYILENLIKNAVKFTEKGSIDISASVIEGAGQFVEFQVKDTGIGIPKERLPAIFEKFHQLDSSETRKYGGVGLGLYIAKKFAELLGGTIAVESEVGKGSTFTVTLPLDQ